MDGSILQRDGAGLGSGAGNDDRDGVARLDLHVTGMSCAACVRRVERAAAAVPGVADVAVNLATERATVTPEPGLRLPDLAAALATAGYPVAEDTVDLAITGMSCASCVSRLEKALRSVPGVADAAVNLATNRAALRLGAGTDPMAAVEAVAVGGVGEQRDAAQLADVLRGDVVHLVFLFFLLGLQLYGRRRLGCGHVCRDSDSPPASRPRRRRFRLEVVRIRV